MILSLIYELRDWLIAWLRHLRITFIDFLINHWINLMMDWWM